jgi:hypothetical protein
VNLHFTVDVTVKNNALTSDTPASELEAIVAFAMEHALRRALGQYPWVLEIEITP